MITIFKKIKILGIGLILLLSIFLVYTKIASAYYIDMSGRLWAFTFDVSSEETSLSINFNNWVNGTSGIRSGSNIQVYSPQSLNAPNEDHIIIVNNGTKYVGEFDLIPGSDGDASKSGRQIKVIVRAFEFIDDEYFYKTGATPTIYSGQEVVEADIVVPVITLLGDTTVNLVAGEVYEDAGATALDNIDGNLTYKIEVGGDTIDTTQAGTYKITYNVSDSMGNKAIEVTRIVIVSESESQESTPAISTSETPVIEETPVEETVTEVAIPITAEETITETAPTEETTTTEVVPTEETSVAENVSEETETTTVEESPVLETPVTQEATAEITEPITTEATTTEATTESPVFETTTTETTTEEVPSVGELIQESTSSLLNGMWNFLRWIYTLIF